MSRFYFKEGSFIKLQMSLESVSNAFVAGTLRFRYELWLEKRESSQTIWLPGQRQGYRCEAGSAKTYFFSTDLKNFLISVSKYAGLIQ